MMVRIRRIDAAAVVGIGLAQAAALAATLLLVRSIVDALAPAGVGQAAADQRHHTYLLVALLCVTALVQAALRALEFSVAEKAGYEVVRRLRLEMYEHLQGMTPTQLQYRARGGLMLRFIGDLSMLRLWISRGILRGTVALIVVTATLTAMAVLNVWLALAVLAVISGGSAASIGWGKAMRAATRRMRRRRSLVTGNIDEQLNSLAVVQVFGRARGEFSRLAQQTELLTQALCRIAGLRGRLRGISSATAALSVAAVLGVGLVEVSRYATTVGTVVAALLMTQQLSGPVRNLGLAHDYWHRGQVSQQKITEFINSSSSGLEPAGTQPLRLRSGRVEFVNAAVEGRLPAISAVAAPGRIVGICGAAGSGKSSLLALVARQLETTSGDVLIDGQVLASTSPASAFRQLGVVSPDLPLMRGTVWRNLTYRMPNASRHEIQRVCYALGLDELVSTLPGGFEFWVTEGGRNLSTAERQLLCLGRALINSPKVLLFDQPTLGLDPTQASTVRKYLAGYRGTVLLASTQPADLAIADVVWDLGSEGRISVVEGDEYRRSPRTTTTNQVRPWVRNVTA
ncbi:ABC transporter transmembrane domain-containing protein [Nocardioides kongjuensis]|uniref:ABC-type multidrug transport system fused ATPase/permease subunit n=1 Tax=Nocardioides kongjuensis TaxID=349522 RepID=A0A852RV22_9ACTN|nr:ABC transporter ATP-binding protein [Nocardioides kongjuensis]NYD32720.1 ABC-type multidrug transport system fused ATPase/permease subunit [Nocardioides kongjuensis]